MAASTTTTSDMPLLNAGTNICIKDLVGAPQYNKLKGVVLSFQEDTGRYNVQVKVSNKPKQLGLKPKNISVLCSKCKQVQCQDQDNGCSRCQLPYCSARCRETDWKMHKATCVPKNLPEPPEPVNEADTGDEIFEAARKYMDLGTQANRDGRYAEFLHIMEALVQKDDKQPAAFLQLFDYYSHIQEKHDRAFECLERAVELLTDPRVEVGSDPQSVAAHPSEHHDVTALYGPVIRKGRKFIEDHRVVGRAGLEEIKPSMLVLNGLTRLETKVPLEDTAVLTRYDRSELRHTMGNVLRKMDMDDETREFAIVNLRLADAVVQPLDEHNYPALMLIPEIIMSQAVDSTRTSEEKLAKVQAAVDEAREILRLLEAGPPGPPDAFIPDSQIQVGTMLYNQCMLRKDEPSQETMREIYTLLSAGHDTALERGDMRLVNNANRILQNIQTS